MIKINTSKIFKSLLVVSVVLLICWFGVNLFFLYLYDNHSTLEENTNNSSKINFQKNILIAEKFNGKNIQLVNEVFPISNNGEVTTLTSAFLYETDLNGTKIKTLFGEKILKESEATQFCQDAAKFKKRFLLLSICTYGGGYFVLFDENFNNLSKKFNNYFSNSNYVDFSNTENEIFYTNGDDLYSDDRLYVMDLNNGKSTLIKDGQIADMHTTSDGITFTSNGDKHYYNNSTKQINRQ